MPFETNIHLIRTKQVATLGPATDSPDALAGVLGAGVDICRLNFSHGDHAEHFQRLNRVRDWAREHREPIAVLGDLCGPKIRLNSVAGGEVELERGATVRFVRGEQDCSAMKLTTTLPELIDEVEPGHRIFINDGLVRFLVIEKEPDALVCSSTTGGILSSRKGVNLPDTKLARPALTEKDREDLQWAMEHKLDFVALSFVQRPSDLETLRAILDENNSDIGVIAKLEKPEALEHLDEIIALADGVMVARGDLGVEMDVWQVPLHQKIITRKCREAGKPVIIATQMLQSMIDNPMPTRAEVSDVANAVFDAADAVMLSGESAVGDYPIDSVEMMGRVARTMETFQALQPTVEYETQIASKSETTCAITRAAVKAARHLNAKLVAAWTATGETVRLLARHRLSRPLIGLSFDERVCRRINLLYGVIPLHMPFYDSSRGMVAALNDAVKAKGLAVPGDVIVIVLSTSSREPGGTDTTLVHTIR